MIELRRAPATGLTASAAEFTRRIGIASAGRRRVVAFGAGAASILAMAPFHLWPVLWITLPALCVLNDTAVAVPAEVPRYAWWRHSALGRVAETGWWFGFGYHLAGLYWIGEPFLIEAEAFAWLIPFAVTLMPAGLALFTAGAAAASHFALRLTPLERVAVLAIAFGVTEWLRGHILTGFPWNVLGYALTYPLALMQSASVLGIYGLTVVAVLVFAGPFALLRSATVIERERVRVLAAVTLAIVPLGLMLAAGGWRLAGVPPPSEGVLRPKIRIVQPSVPQRDRLMPEKQRPIFDQHLALSLTAPDGRIDAARGIDLIVWPEAAMPFVALAQPVALTEIGQMLPEGALLAAGAKRAEPGPTRDSWRVFNSLLLFARGESAVLLGQYDKIHLVPFGEYLPAQPVLEAIGLSELTRQRGGFAAGDALRMPLVMGRIGRVLPLICYEAIFPAVLRIDGDRPDVLLNLTNDAWFGQTTGPRQHYHQTRVRAVEEGLPLVRASNNGISAVFDGNGRELVRLELNAVGTLDARLPRRLAPPTYARFGDKIFLLLIVLLAAAVAVRAFWQRREPQRPLTE